jgi:predicted TIM-barrel fold metal-dependent hydrolase
MITRRELLSLVPVAGALQAAKAAAPTFERFDCHVHLHEHCPPIIAGLERTHWTALLVCLCGGVADEEYDMEALLNKTAKLHREAKGRLPWVAAFDARDWERPDFAERNIAMLNRAFKQDALGVKIWKNLGMAIKSKKTGEYLKPDNEALMPIYAAIQKADRTLMAHTAEPAGAFSPRPPQPQGGAATQNGAGRGNPDYWTLYKRGNAPDNWWAYENHLGSPGKEELLQARDRILARNPKLRVVGVHIGSNEEDIGALAKRLDTYPNFNIDVAARVNVLARLEPTAAREFLTRYQDRIVYGSDSVVLDEKAGDEESWERINAAQEREWNFFATTDTITFGAGGRQPNREVPGLGLPEKVLRKIFNENPKRLFPGITKK